MIETVSDPDQYAAEVMDPDRSYPLVLLTSRQGEQEPALDRDAVEAIVGDGARIDFMPTSFRTRRLQELLPTKLAVFGGAARIWWPGVSATSDPYDHPLIHDPYGTYGAKALDLLRRRWEEGPPTSSEGVEPELVVAKRDRDRAKESLERARAEIAQLRSDVSALTERAERAEETLTELRRRQRAVTPTPERRDKGDQEPEVGFHVLIVNAWAEALTRDDRLSTPLQPYRIGPKLLASINSAPGASVERVAWICAMVACGRAPTGSPPATQRPRRLRPATVAERWRARVALRSETKSAVGSAFALLGRARRSHRIRRRSEARRHENHSLS